MCKCKKGPHSKATTMKVFCFGLPRTAMHEAFEILGITPAFNEDALLHEPNTKTSEWAARIEALAAGARPPHEQQFDNWESLLHGYAATEDAPAFFFWKPLVGAYPDAKVILTVRESPEAWYASFAHTVGADNDGWRQKWPVNVAAALGLRLGILPPDLRVMFASGNLYDRLGVLDGNGDTAMRWYGSHNEAVKNYVPQDRLLVYDVREGWPKLCAFLSKPIPEEKFPSANARDKYRTTSDQNRKVIVKRLVSMMGLIVGLGLGVLGTATWWLRLRLIVG